MRLLGGNYSGYGGYDREALGQNNEVAQIINQNLAEGRAVTLTATGRNKCIFNSQQYLHEDSHRVFYSSAPFKHHYVNYADSST